MHASTHKCRIADSSTSVRAGPIALGLASRVKPYEPISCTIVITQMQQVGRRTLLVCHLHVHVHRRVDT